MNVLVRLAMFASLALSSCTAPSGSTPQWSEEELGHFHRAVSTRSPAAQRWFDQGLVLCFGFDQEAARQAFAERPMRAATYTVPGLREAGECAVF